VEALAYAKALAPFKLRWFEEPCDPLDFALLAELASVYQPPLATGENLFSTQDVENLARFGGFRADRDIIQIDPPQSYGISQYARTLDMLGRALLAARARCFPHGGNQMSARHRAASAWRRGVLSGVFGFGGFADDAPHRKRRHHAVDRPGIGFEARQRCRPHHARRWRILTAVHAVEKCNRRNNSAVRMRPAALSRRLR